MDVWFDSGSTWAAVAAERPYLKYPADLYLEGGDQYRGWFQSSMLTSIAVNGVAPYKQIATHAGRWTARARPCTSPWATAWTPRRSSRSTVRI